MSLILDGTNGETFPSWTTATRPASPAVGQMGYNTTTGQFDAYTASGWVTILPSAAGSSTQLPSSAMPTGSVLQVVSAIYSTSTANSTTNHTDTGLTVSITPKFSTSKILVLVNQNGVRKSNGNANNACYISLVRNSTDIATSNYAGYMGTAQDLVIGSVSISYLDSPATTSATTYKTQFWNFANAAQVSVQDGNCQSTITVMEIAG